MLNELQNGSIVKEFSVIQKKEAMEVDKEPAGDDDDDNDFVFIDKTELDQNMQSKN